MSELSRDELEKLALEKVDAILYYDLADNIDGATDYELYEIIDNTGDYKALIDELKDE